MIKSYACILNKKVVNIVIIDSEETQLIEDTKIAFEYDELVAIEDYIIDPESHLFEVGYNLVEVGWEYENQMFIKPKINI